MKQNDLEAISMMRTLLKIMLIILIPASAVGQQPAEYLMKAKALKDEGKSDASINLLTEAISKNEDHRLYIDRAEVKILKGDFSGAISDLNEANRLTPLSGEYGLSRVYAKKADAATSVYHLGLSMNSLYKKSEKEILLNPDFRKIENSTEWRQFWKKEQYSIIEKGISEIEYYLSNGKIGESEEIISSLKKEYVNDPLVNYGEALINLARNNNSEVIKNISGLLITNPENEKYLRLIGQAQFNSSNFAGASVTYTKLITIGIPDADLLLLRAECYMKTAEIQNALIDIKKFIEIYPLNKKALRMAGKAEGISGDNIKAMEYFSKNLELHPNDPDCYIDRANSYFVSKSWALALNDYSMSLDLKPDNSDAWLNKGITLLSTGKIEDACHDFRKSFSMGNKKASEYISKNCLK